MTIKAALLGCMLLCSAATAQSVEPAPEYETIFRRDKGWTGADGTYSYPLPDGRVIWGFSDTFFGDVVDGVRQQPFRFVNNSMVLQESLSSDRPKAEFLPAPVFTPPGGKSWFWLFDGADGDEILLGEFDGHGDGGFGFRQVGLWSARYRLHSNGSKILASDLKRLPFHAQNSGEAITFGPAILETPGWLYLYGVRDKGGARQSVLARAPHHCLADAGTWRFFDGQGWSKDIARVKPLFNGAAMEASVHLTRSGQFMYVGTDAGGMGPDIIARLAPSPQGPWGEPVAITKAVEHNGDVFTYNAKAHPELSANGRLLVSYNVNTSDLAKVVADADIYRPRFFWWTPPNSDWLPAVKR